MATSDDNQPQGWGDSWGDDDSDDNPAEARDLPPRQDPAVADDLANTQALNPVKADVDELGETQAMDAVVGPDSEGWDEDDGEVTLDPAAASGGGSGQSPVAPGPPSPPWANDVKGEAAAPGAPEDHLPPRKGKAAAPGASPDHLPRRKKKKKKAPAADNAGPDASSPDGEETALDTLPGEAVTAFSAVEVEEGKVLAAISHAGNVFGIPIWIYPLFMKKDNRFEVFHAKQAALGTALYWVGWAIVTALGSVTCGVGFIAGLVLPAIGLWPAIQAYNGKPFKFPMLGDMAEDLLKGQQVEGE